MKDGLSLIQVSGQARPKDNLKRFLRATVTKRPMLHNKATAYGLVNGRPITLLNPTTTMTAAAMTRKGSGMNVTRIKKDLNCRNRAWMNNASGLSTKK